LLVLDLEGIVRNLENTVVSKLSVIAWFELKLGVEGAIAR
jgi:hypothetical protein